MLWEWVAGLVEQGLSPSRIRNAHQVLSQILAVGVEGGRIARNPAAGVRLPRIVRRDMHFLTARQVEDLAAAIDLRHTCASLLIAQGTSVKAVQAQLGHASATVTLDR